MTKTKKEVTALSELTPKDTETSRNYTKIELWLGMIKLQLQILELKLDLKK